MRRFMLLCLLLCSGVLFADEPAPISSPDRAFEARQFAVARDLYEQARATVRDAERDPASRARWLALTTKLVRCSTALGDRERATEEFYLLCRIESSTPPEFAPLPWFVPLNAPSMTRPREKSAEDWLDPVKNKVRSPSATLLAAAVLSVSTSPGKRSQGFDLLRALAGQLEDEPGKDPMAELRNQTALLAGAMLWQQRIPTLQKPGDLAPLRRYLERVPEPLRAGPLYLFGRAARLAGEPEDAVLAWMRLPILYPDDRPLCAEALREAAATLEKLGRPRQAETLRREAAETFGP